MKTRRTQNIESAKSMLSHYLHLGSQQASWGSRTGNCIWNFPNNPGHFTSSICLFMLFCSLEQLSHHLKVRSYFTSTAIFIRSC